MSPGSLPRPVRDNQGHNRPVATIIKPMTIRVRDISLRSISAASFSFIFGVSLSASRDAGWPASTRKSGDAMPGWLSSRSKISQSAGRIGRYLELTSLAQVPHGPQAREKVEVLLSTAARLSADMAGCRIFGSTWAGRCRCRRRSPCVRLMNSIKREGAGSAGVSSRKCPPRGNISTLAL